MTDSTLGLPNADIDNSDEGARRVAAPVTRSSVRSLRVTAILASVIGILLTVSLPLLPVIQDRATLSWPQNGTLDSVEAPLVSYAPLRLDLEIPCSAISQLTGRGGILVATAPAGAAEGQKYGLVARVRSAAPGDTARVEITLRGRILLSESVDRLPPEGCSLRLSSDSVRTTAGFVTGGGTPPTVVTGGGTPPTVLEGDLRPQMSGIFSDLSGPVPDGLQVNALVDSRFSTTPSGIKVFAALIGVLATILALSTLHRLDSLDGRRSRRFLPPRWWTFGAVDALVIGTLALWQMIGATTSDDGYQFTMARASETAGYMANYFRWYGVPETPFGTPYYDLLALLARISPASPFMRLPALAAGILAWLVISREVVPRLGTAVRASRLALWTGGLVFLAFWLPYDNGLRPEPIVATGVLLTWCSVERAVATRRLLPAAMAILIGAVTVTAGPSGVICFGALIAGARPILQIVITRAKAVGYLALLGPLLAAGTVILVAVFADQTLAATIEMQRVHTISPHDPWSNEYLRYQWLLNPVGADGSLSRRFGVFVMVLSIAVSLLVMLRRGGRIPGTATGPSRRLIGITVAAMLLMTFTPTKWTHHFGIYAGLAGALAVLATVAVSTLVLRSARNRALFASAVLLLLAVTFTGTNGWWYVSSWGVPWWDKQVSIAGLDASTVLLGATLLMSAIAAWYHVREPYVSKAPHRLWAIPPLTVAASAMVLFEVLSLAKGAVAQYPAYSLTRSNLDSLFGEHCGLADHVLLETDPNSSVLQPLSGEAGTALAGSESIGFTPDGVARDLSADREASSTGVANSVDTDNPGQSAPGSSAGTGGGSGAVGINGSTVALPFGLDPATTPVLGSFEGGQDSGARLTTGWYRLPAADPDGSRGDIVSIAAAGRIRSVDSDGIVTYGQSLEVEYGTVQPDGTVSASGRVTPLDIGPAPSWRNLRVPLDSLPNNTDVIRIVAADTDIDPQQWLAVTPPRVPRTRTLDEVIGSRTPVLVDWEVGFSFPCQRPFDHRVGVAEIPEYRILPDHPGAVMTSLWQDRHGGGPLGWIEMTRASRTVPSYLENDWDRDWGAVEQYSPLDPTAKTAKIDTSRTERSGLWSPGPIITAY